MIVKSLFGCGRLPKASPKCDPRILLLDPTLTPDLKNVIVLLQIKSYSYHKGAVEAAKLKMGPWRMLRFPVEGTCWWGSWTFLYTKHLTAEARTGVWMSTVALLRTVLGGDELWLYFTSRCTFVQLLYFLFFRCSEILIQWDLRSASSGLYSINIQIQSVTVLVFLFSRSFLVLRLYLKLSLICWNLPWPFIAVHAVSQYCDVLCVLTFHIEKTNITTYKYLTFCTRYFRFYAHFGPKELKWVFNWFF